MSEHDVLEARLREAFSQRAAATTVRARGGQAQEIPVVDMEAERRRRRPSAPWLAAVAAIVTVLGASVVVVTRPDEGTVQSPDTVETTLPTETLPTETTIPDVRVRPAGELPDSPRVPPIALEEAGSDALMAGGIDISPDAGVVQYLPEPLPAGIRVQEQDDEGESEVDDPMCLAWHLDDGALLCDEIVGTLYSSGGWIADDGSSLAVQTTYGDALQTHIRTFPDSAVRQVVVRGGDASLTTSPSHPDLRTLEWLEAEHVLVTVTQSGGSADESLLAFAESLAPTPVTELPYSQLVAAVAHVPRSYIRPEAAHRNVYAYVGNTLPSPERPGTICANFVGLYATGCYSIFTDSGFIAVHEDFETLSFIVAANRDVARVVVLNASGEASEELELTDRLDTDYRIAIGISSPEDRASVVVAYDAEGNRLQRKELSDTFKYQSVAG